MKQAIIFDFDGTIADSFEYVFNFLWGQARKDYVPEKAEVDSYRHMHMRDMARKMGIAWWRLPALYFRGRKQMNDRVADVKPFPGMVEQIRSLHEADYTLYILSASSRRTIRHFIKHYDLHDCFRAVYAGAVPFGKEPLIRRMVRHQHLKSIDCWMVGDLGTDALAAKSQGMRSIAVSWGFDEHESLVKAADYVVDTPDEISKIIIANTDTI